MRFKFNQKQPNEGNKQAAVPSAKKISLKKIKGNIGTLIDTGKKQTNKITSLAAPVVDKVTPPFIKRLNSNYKVALGITFVLFLWMGSGLIGKEPIAEIDVSQRDNNNIKSVLVREFFISPTERIVRLSGKSKEERKVSIKSELSTQVDRIIASDGSEVIANQSILRLEQEEALARLRQAQSQERQAELEYSSQRQLLRQRLTSSATVAKAQGDYEASKAASALAQKQFDATRVEAPFTGRVEKIYVAEGDFVQPGQLLADIFDYDPLVIIGDLSEVEVGFVKQGGEVKVTFITGEVVQGNVSYVAQTADPESRTFEVQVSIPNPDKSLRAGVTAEMAFSTGAVEAVKIPASIISINDEGKIGVKGVDARDQVVFYPIEVVKAETNEMWVSGIDDGAKLIIRGFGFVELEEKVEVQTESGI